LILKSHRQGAILRCHARLSINAWRGQSQRILGQVGEFSGFPSQSVMQRLE
jgi:hypothetical protein